MVERRKDCIDVKSALFGAGIMAIIFISSLILTSYTVSRTVAANSLAEDQCIVVVEPDTVEEVINPPENMDYESIESDRRLYLGTEVSTSVSR